MPFLVTPFNDFFHFFIYILHGFLLSALVCYSLDFDMDVNATDLVVKATSQPWHPVYLCHLDWEPRRI
jgi:hypothetical protein